MRKRILLADSDENIKNELSSLLSLNDYEVITISDGREALETAKTKSIDLVILEVDMPEMDGFSVCKTLRIEGYKKPIIFLTNRMSEINAVIGLELGAQDYIRKPLQSREFIARINGVLKREESKKTNSKVEVVGIEIELESRKVKYKDNSKELTNKEFQLLYAFVSCPNKVFSRDELLGRVWDCIGNNVETRTVDLHVGYLRKKFEENPKRPKLFKTIRGVGYFLEGEENEPATLL